MKLMLIHLMTERLYKRETIFLALKSQLSTEAQKTEIKQLLDYHQVLFAADGFDQIFNKPIHCHYCQKGLSSHCRAKHLAIKDDYLMFNDQRLNLLIYYIHGVKCPQNMELTRKLSREVGEDDYVLPNI